MKWNDSTAAIAAAESRNSSSASGASIVVGLPVASGVRVGVGGGVGVGTGVGVGVNVGVGVGVGVGVAVGAGVGVGTTSAPQAGNTVTSSKPNNRTSPRTPIMARIILHPGIARHRSDKPVLYFPSVLSVLTRAPI